MGQIEATFLLQVPSNRDTSFQCVFFYEALVIYFTEIFRHYVWMTNTLFSTLRAKLHFNLLEDYYCSTGRFMMSASHWVYPTIVGREEATTLHWQQAVVASNGGDNSIGYLHLCNISGGSAFESGVLLLCGFTSLSTCRTFSYFVRLRLYPFPGKCAHTSPANETCGRSYVKNAKLIFFLSQHLSSLLGKVFKSTIKTHSHTHTHFFAPHAWRDNVLYTRR